MNDKRALDLGVIALVAVISLVLIYNMGGEREQLSADVSSTRMTIQQLTSQRNRLAERPDLDQLTTQWRQSKFVTDQCGVDRSVSAGVNDDSLYGGSGTTWTAVISGEAIAVLTCADQLSKLDQIVFERVGVKSDDSEQTAQVAFSIYGLFNPRQAMN